MRVMSPATTLANPQSLVSTQWLAEHLQQPDLRIVDSDYYEAGPDQALMSGAWNDLAAALAHPLVAAAVRALAQRMMGMGRTLHWRGHNYLLVDDVLGRGQA